jgi:hypothetical protein
MSKYNVNILFLRPIKNVDVLKAFFGLPVSSVCLVVDGQIWSFKARTGIFECRPYNSAILKTHIIIDTKVTTNHVILEELNKLLGESRTPYCKCVWTIRRVLNLLGGKFAIKNWFDYIPGIYASKIMKV